MAFGKKLGHSPLGFNMTGNSNYDFIPDRRSQTETIEHMETKEEVRSVIISEEEEDMPPKKIASYYLSEDTILLLKKYSKINRKSYSHVVEKALTQYLENNNW